MKALRKLGKGAESVRLCEVEKPVPGPADLLVKVMAAGICGTDLHILAEEYSHSVPVTLGHEYTGVVEQVGRDVTDFAVGDQVISVSIAYSCGKCHYCRKGDPVHCTQKASIGVNVDGAMADYVIIPADTAMKVPEKMVGSDLLALSEPIACCIRAVLEKSEIHAGDVAVVSGPGIIGLLCVQLAKLRGARVVLSGTKADKERLELARELGADWVCDNGDDLEALLARETAYGPDVWIECSGAAPALSQGIRLIRKQGAFIQVGLYGKPVPMDMDTVVRKELKVTAGFAQARSSWEILLKLLEGDSLKLEPLVTTRVPLADWEKGFEQFRNKEGIKIFLVP